MDAPYPSPPRKLRRDLIIGVYTNYFNADSGKHRQPGAHYYTQSEMTQEQYSRGPMSNQQGTGTYRNWAPALAPPSGGGYGATMSRAPQAGFYQAAPAPTPQRFVSAGAGFYQAAPAPTLQQSFPEGAVSYSKIGYQQQGQPTYQSQGMPNFLYSQSTLQSAFQPNPNNLAYTASPTALSSPPIYSGYVPYQDNYRGPNVNRVFNPPAPTYQQHDDDYERPGEVPPGYIRVTHTQDPQGFYARQRKYDTYPQDF
jgi:hypothetical protein